MIQYDKILYPTDFSDASAPAAEHACVFAEKFDADLHILNVIPETLPVAVPEYGGGLWPEEFLERAETSARQTLSGMPGGEWSERLRVVRTTRRGTAYVEILRYADEHEIDLIVMGTHGRSGLMHLLIGSVAERVVRGAKCPVLTVRPDGHQGSRS